jgi:hypothetical protein
VLYNEGLTPHAPLQEVIPGSWNELQDELFYESWNTSLERFRSPFVFRGVSDKNHKLMTSLMRLGGNYAQLERHLLRNFRKYAHREVVEKDSVWHWLSLAAHHSLPTRLLDWTYSPLVALHFATADISTMHLDAAVWTVNYIEAAKKLPRVLRSHLQAEGSNVFTVELLSRIPARRRGHLGDSTFQINTLEALDKLSRSDFLLFLEPPSLDDRIVNQFALFSMISNPKTAVDVWLSKHPELYRKVIVPAKLKWEIRDKLDQANITERVLVGGLDGLTAWLRRHYSPKAL